MEISFNGHIIVGDEFKHIEKAISAGYLSGNQGYTQLLKRNFKDLFGFENCFFTPSCTSAMEMACVLVGLKPGDEVILPSFTFPSTANAPLLNGAKLVFCDVDPKTMNMDLNLCEKLITDKTKMIIAVDYMGVPVDLDRLDSIAKKNNIITMQDSAQSLGSKYKDKWVGSMCDFTAFSFHQTKNIQCGEGGLLVINNPNFVGLAYHCQEKGTNRKDLIDGKVNKYWWVTKGSSYILSDILAAFLLTQVQNFEKINRSRVKVLKRYQKSFEPFCGDLVEMQDIPKECSPNGHGFYLVFKTKEIAKNFVKMTKIEGVSAISSYIPLHSSPMGLSLGYKANDLPLTESLASRLVRLPIHSIMKKEHLEYSIDAIHRILVKLQDSIAQKSRYSGIKHNENKMC